MSARGQEQSADPRQEASAAISRAQAELERAVEELDRLPALDRHSIALAAHALNNFLTVSGGVVDLLIPALRQHPDARIVVWLEGLAHANGLMSHTVSQLMNRSVGVATTLRLEDVELPRLVERTCAYYQPVAEFKGLELRFRASPDVRPIRTDRVLVAAVLDNLLSNAVKYSPPGKRISVYVRSHDDGVVCDVQDEGPGLSLAEQGRLFQPGGRVGPVPSGGEASSGYGLAIAKRFADQLSGRLTCASTVGLGSTFSLWLPRTPHGAQDDEGRSR
jgi:two-component system, sensor histidine kinase LadS